MGVAQTFYVRAVWDPDTHVFYSESDIIGLHVEAETFSDFAAVVKDVAPDLLAANHPTSSQRELSFIESPRQIIVQPREYATQ